MAEPEKPADYHRSGKPDLAGTSGLGCANSLAAVSGIVWAVLFIRAASHYSDVAEYGYPDATEACDFWVYLPLALAIGSLLIALVVNCLIRSWASLQIVFSFISLAGVLPYLVMTSGGV